MGKKKQNTINGCFLLRLVCLIHSSVDIWIYLYITPSVLPCEAARFPRSCDLHIYLVRLHALHLWSNTHAMNQSVSYEELLETRDDSYIHGAIASVISELESIFY